MEEVVEYQNLLPYQFEARIATCPVVYVPVGSLEWHGEHLALGNDSIKMHGVCCEAARIGGGIVYPPQFFGMGCMVPFGRKYTHDGDLPVSEEFFTTVVNTTLAGLEAVGFKVTILATGHTSPEQSAQVRKIGESYAGKMMVRGTDDMEWADDLDFTSDHAAKWETSMLWYLRPELVDITRLPKDLSEPCEGVGGDDPRVHAGPELGKAAVEAVARDLANLAAGLIEK